MSAANDTHRPPLAYLDKGYHWLCPFDFERVCVSTCMAWRNLHGGGEDYGYCARISGEHGHDNEGQWGDYDD